MDQTALLQLLRLSSPALPIGAFAWSQGLESAIECEWVRDEKHASAWIIELAENMLCQTDLPVMLRVHDLANRRDLQTIQYWNDMLLSMRESHELWLEDTQLGAALKKVLLSDEAGVWYGDIREPAYAVMFALAARQNGIDNRSMLGGFLWAWAENLVAAAIKVVPLGQSAGQRILRAFIDCVPGCIDRAIHVEDREIGAVMPGLALASAWHESQYSRLFRS